MQTSVCPRETLARIMHNHILHSVKLIRNNRRNNAANARIYGVERRRQRPAFIQF